MFFDCFYFGVLNIFCFTCATSFFTFFCDKFQRCVAIIMCCNNNVRHTIRYVFSLFNWTWRRYTVRTTEMILEAEWNNIPRCYATPCTLLVVITLGNYSVSIPQNGCAVAPFPYDSTKHLSAALHHWYMYQNIISDILRQISARSLLMFKHLIFKTKNIIFKNWNIWFIWVFIRILYKCTTRSPFILFAYPLFIPASIQMQSRWKIDGGVLNMVFKTCKIGKRKRKK